MKLKKNTSVGEMKQLFCDDIGLDSSLTRLLFNGARLGNESTMEIFEDGDIIEAFKCCSGGGPQPKKSKLFTEDQIKAALSESSEDSESDSSSFTYEAFETQDNEVPIIMDNHKTVDKSSEQMENSDSRKSNTDKLQKEKDDRQECREKEPDENSNLVSTCHSNDDINKFKETGIETLDELWLEKLRRQNNNGELLGNLYRKTF